jgi:hypothetical protein
MKCHTRSLGALVALLALTVYFGESVWASMCSPQMQMSGMAEVVDDDAPEHVCTMGMHDACDAESPDPPHSDMMDCPFGPLGANGSCVALSLPATTAHMEPSFPEGLEPTASADAARDRLLDTALFHPPKA